MLESEQFADIRLNIKRRKSHAFNNDLYLNLQNYANRQDDG